MSYLTAYFILKLTDFIVLFKGIAGISCCIGGFIILFSDKIKKARRYFILSFTVMVLFYILSILTPTTKQVGAIYVLPNIVNNENLQETIKQVPELSNLGLQHLKEILTEGLEEKTNELNKIEE